MSKGKKNKAGQRVFLAKNKGGRTRTADLSMDPDEERPKIDLPELQQFVTKSCYNLVIEFQETFEKLGLRGVALDSFFEALCEEPLDEARESHLIKVLEGTVIEPLNELCNKVFELKAEFDQAMAAQTRTMYQQQAQADETNFSKMLVAFETKVEEIISLNQQDRERRQAVLHVLKATNTCAEKGDYIRRRVEGSEQELDELVRQTSRELIDDTSSLHSKEGLEERWGKLEQRLTSYLSLKQSFAAALEEHKEHTRKFYIEQDTLGQYRGEWHRQEKIILQGEEVFKSAGLDPFLLSDTLAHLKRQEVLSMPDVAERTEVEAKAPNALDELPASRVEERARNMIREVMAALEALETPPVQPTTTCPVTMTELALCTYAAFVARYANGRPYQLSGRTVQKVYEGMLVPTQFTYGYSVDQLKEAVKEAEAAGYIHCFKRKGRNGGWRWCYQPTVEGFAHAKTLYAKLPPDFRDRILARQEAMQQESSAYRTAQREKEKTSPKEE